MILTCFTCDRQVVANVQSVYDLFAVAIRFGWATIGVKRAFCPHCSEASATAVRPPMVAA